jgi:hypothetical protein
MSQPLKMTRATESHTYCDSPAIVGGETPPELRKSDVSQLDPAEITRGRRRIGSTFHLPGCQLSQAVATDRYFVIVMGIRHIALESANYH